MNIDLIDDVLYCLRTLRLERCGTEFQLSLISLSQFPSGMSRTNESFEVTVDVLTLYLVCLTLARCPVCLCGRLADVEIEYLIFLLLYTLAELRQDFTMVGLKFC